MSRLKQERHSALNFPAGLKHWEKVTRETSRSVMKCLGWHMEVRLLTGVILELADEIQEHMLNT